MRNRKVEMVFCVLFLLLMSVGCSNISQNNATSETTKTAVKLYDEFTDIKLFQGVPAMSVKNGRTDIKGDLGGANQVILVNGSTADEYWSYLDVLQENGFKKYVDNGEEGLYGDVLSSTLTKDDLVLDIIHMKKNGVDLYHC